MRRLVSDALSSLPQPEDERRFVIDFKRTFDLRSVPSGAKVRLRAPLPRVGPTLTTSTFGPTPTSGDETLSNYAAFDAPLSSSLANAEPKELNLMLYDIAATREIAIHLPDGIQRPYAFSDHCEPIGHAFPRVRHLELDKRRS